MNTDRIVGAGKRAAGAAKVLVGKMIGNARLQVDGRTEQVDGKLQHAAGSAKDILRP
jgi:uncharacterized protein YjbJ (UPF0337 family)